MHGEDIAYAYGFWSLVIVNIGLFAFFILNFLVPLKKREWRAMGATLGFSGMNIKSIWKMPMFVPQIIQRDSAENRSF